MFGYACDETSELMPLPIQLAHQLVQRLSTARRQRILEFLRPDGKSQVSVEYVDGRPKRIEALVISTQHAPDIGIEELRRQVKKHVIDAVVPSTMVDSQTKYHINGCSSFRSCDSLGMRELRGCEAPYDSPSLLTTFSMRRLGRDEEAAEGTVSGTR
jgi:S-adenosylmethionine synthetase